MILRRLLIFKVSLTGVLLWSTIVRGQLARPDSVRSDMRLDISNSSVALRIATGGQGSFFYEIGLARNRFDGSFHGIGGYDYYITFVGFPAIRKEETAVSCMRVGADFCGNGMVIGADWSIYWAGQSKHVTFAPKVGIGIPDVYAWYAYNISTNEWIVNRIGSHSVGIQASPFIWRYDKLHQTKRWLWTRTKKKKVIE